MKIHRYINFIYHSTVEGKGLLNELCKFQYDKAVQATENTFTVLDEADGLAFSQRYQKLPDGRARHSHMFKHELGQKNPDVPSYDDLIKHIPDPDSKSMPDMKEIRSLIEESLVKAREDYEKEMREFRTYATIWEAVSAIRDRSHYQTLEQAILNIDKGYDSEKLLELVDEDISGLEETMEKQKSIGFGVLDEKDTSYRINGVKKARIQIKRAINYNQEGGK